MNGYEINGTWSVSREGPVSIAEATIGLVLVGKTRSVLGDNQVLIVTSDALLKVTQLLIALSQIAKCPTLV